MAELCLFSAGAGARKSSREVLGLQEQLSLLLLPSGWDGRRLPAPLGRQEVEPLHLLSPGRMERDSLAPEELGQG